MTTPQAKTVLRTDFAVFNERGVMLKTFNAEECAKSYAQNRSAIMGPLTVAKLITTREDIETYAADE